MDKKAVRYLVKTAISGRAIQRAYEKRIVDTAKRIHGVGPYKNISLGQRHAATDLVGKTEHQMANIRNLTQSDKNLKRFVGVPGPSDVEADLRRTMKNIK